MEKEINGKVYNIKEIGYLDALDVEESKKVSLKEAAKKFLEFTTGLTQEEIGKLTMKEGLELQQAANEVNELDFQEPAKDQNVVNQNLVYVNSLAGH